MTNRLKDWRKQIEILDEKIITLLAKRMNVVKKIGEYKRKQKISALDTNRWEKIVVLRLAQAEKLGLSKEFVEKILQLIHKHSLKTQK